jgi:hypothetical protein
MLRLVEPSVTRRQARRASTARAARIRDRWDRLREVLNERTRLVIVNSP